MSKRITVMIDNDIDKALRYIQANQIKKNERSVSFSKVLNATLRVGLNKSKTKK